MKTIISEIGEILGVKVEEGLGTPEYNRLFAIAEKLSKKPTDEGFEEDVLAAEMEIAAAGGRAMLQSLTAVNALPPAREYKIARVAKGKRIETVSASGVRFSFGPKWVEAVQACKALALNVNNREKLNMHGAHVGIQEPEKMSARELCLAIASAIQ